MRKVMVITGTRKGIGKQLAEYYLKNGYCVVGCSRGNSNIDRPNYQHYQLDIADERSVVRMIRDIYKKHHKIDILLNNAGIASMNSLVLTPLDKAHRVFDTNFFGSFIFLREVAKIMLKQKSGRIINFSTVAVPLKLEGEAIYSASKSAVETLTKIAAKELGVFGITINAVGPTPVQTDLIKAVPKEKIDNLLNRQAIRRFAEFSDIINVIDFFINEKSSFITGQIIFLGGV